MGARVSGGVRSGSEEGERPRRDGRGGRRPKHDGDHDGAAGAGGDTQDPTGTAGASGGDTAGTAGGGDAGTSGAAGTSGSAGANGDAGASGGAGGADGDAGTTSDAGAVVEAGPPINGCDRSAWTFTPSVVCTTACAGMTAAQKLPANAIDGDMSTRYTTGIDQGTKGPESVVLSFAAPVSITGITLYAKATTDFPVMYRVESSTDGLTFVGFTPPVEGPGLTTLNLPFPARTTLRAVRVTQTGTGTHWWSINEMNVVGCTPPP